MSNENISANGVVVSSVNPLPVTSESGKATYSVQVSDFTAVAATATDVLALVGSATKTIRVNRVQITADATAASVLDFYTFKRTTANTGGTATQPAICKLDSADPAPTAVANLYTVNPTALGTGVMLAADHYALPAAATTGYPGTPWVEEFGTRNNRQVVLRGVGESLAVGCNAEVIPAGINLYIRIEWTEE